LKAFNATGNPPPPCPRNPRDEGERRTLGLPPLFKPILVPLDYLPRGSASRPSAGNTAAPRVEAIAVLERLPLVQTFRPTEVPISEGFSALHTADHFQSISAHLEFRRFSFEVCSSPMIWITPCPPEYACSQKDRNYDIEHTRQTPWTSRRKTTQEALNLACLPQYISLYLPQHLSSTIATR
jgi:hypothetical protein